jgi:aminopeptidase N
MSVTDDAMLRGSIWITVHNGVHHARLDPARAVDVIVAGIPSEELDTAVSALGTWTAEEGEGSRNTFQEKLIAVVRDERPARQRLFAAYLERAQSAGAGSDLQLAAAQAAVSTAVDPAPLRALLAGDLVSGLEVDSGLRWRVLKRLTSLGDTDLDELDKALSEENDAKTELAHAWCRARLPLPETKAWAWQRFTGEANASNYEIEATGMGMWQSGQDDLLAQYAERYFEDLPATTAVRTGWVVGTAARCFYPMSLNSPDVLARTDETLTDPGLDARLRRELVDAGDELRSRLECRRRYS